MKSRRTNINNHAFITFSLKACHIIRDSFQKTKISFYKNLQKQKKINFKNYFTNVYKTFC